MGRLAVVGYLRNTEDSFEEFCWSCLRQGTFKEKDHFDYQVKMSLSGWICLVTGASRGIGRGIALQLSEAGATVYITGRQEKTLKQTAAEVKDRGGNCVPVICDSSKDEDIEELFV